MAVPLIDFGVIKKGSLSPCLKKNSSELRWSGHFGNAALELLQNPAFPMTQISFSMQKYHQVLCKPASQDLRNVQTLVFFNFPICHPLEALSRAVAQANSKPSVLSGYQTPSHWRSYVVQQKTFLEEKLLLFWARLFTAP